jgi:esterase/lipase superfamily enzyme
MLVEHHGWHSPRLGRGMGIEVYGHYGAPVVVFPTSGGDQREYAGQGMIEALAHWIDAGRVKLYCVDTVNNQSWYDKGAHPRHRSYMQAMYDAYVAEEVAPFVAHHCQSPGIGITTTGASFGAYHAANTLFKHPDKFKRCLALSGVYDIRRFMDGDYDDNFYYNNPVDYVGGLSDPWYLAQLASCDIRLVTGNGPFEDSGPTFRFSEVLNAKGIAHSVDDWGGDGGHDWPYWKRQMNEYLARLPW